MADAFVSTFIDAFVSTFIDAFVKQIKIISNVNESVESLKKESLMMNAFIESIEVMAEPSLNATKWMEKASRAAGRAEDLISQYERSLAKKKLASLLKVSYWKEMHELTLELEKVTHEIHNFSEEGKKILTDRNLNLLFSSQEGSGNIFSSALNQLNIFLSQNWFLPGDQLRRLKNIRDEMVPLDQFLAEVDVEAEDERDERQRIWLQEVKYIFRLLEESLLSFQHGREENIKDLKYFSPTAMLAAVRGSVRGLSKEIVKIEKRIAAVSSRYHFYGIGEFKVRDGLRSMVPQMKSHMDMEPIKSSSTASAATEINIQRMIIAELFGKNPSMFVREQFLMDLKLMPALFKDASKMEDSDQRTKVWLQQMGVIDTRLQSLVTYAIEMSEGRDRVDRRLLRLLKILRETKEIEKEMCHVLVRKTRYEIGSFIAENKSAENRRITEVDSSQFTIPGKLAKQIQLMKELQLMDALLEDISTMEKLDARFKLWLQEIKGIAREARAIIAQDFRGIFGKVEVARKMRKINKWIDDISEWKRTYDIGEAKATNGPSSISHDLEAAEAYPSGIVGAAYESLRRELNLMKALDDDIKELVGIDGKLEVWMGEMRVVAGHAEKCIDKHGQITMKRGIECTLHLLNSYMEIKKRNIIRGTETLSPFNMALLLLVSNLQIFTEDSIVLTKDKIQKLHERRIRYGIEKINGLPANDNAEVADQDRLLMQPEEEETLSPESSTVSHENAPHDLWRRLFHFLLFPHGREIPARRLIALWVAEGLEGPKRGDDRPAEYFCEQYLHKLVRRRMVRAKKKPNGKFKSCQLCDDVREMLLKKAAEANFLQNESDMTFRLKVHYEDRNPSYGHIDGSIPCPSSQLKTRYKKVTCFLSFDTEEGGKHGEDIGNFLQRCISKRCFLSLRVLDLERVFKPKLPSALGILTGLRYLGLRWTYLESLPDAVSKLLNLLVLDVKRTYITALPKSIWNMQYLRHLYLSETYRTRFVNRPRNKSLTQLLTLWGAFIDEDTPVSNGLDTIVNVRKLGLTCRSMSSADEMKEKLIAVGDWILKLEHLENLRLKSFDGLGNPSYLHLKPLSGHTNLSTVYLVGKFKYPSIVSEFPVNLTEITLSGSELEEDPMGALQKLKNLIILRLLSRSSTCRTMRCSRGGFPQLRVLKIWNLEDLTKWEMEKGALPLLNDLKIRNCPNLEMIPHELAYLENLRKLELSDKFEDIIKEKQPIVWDKINHLFSQRHQPKQKEVIGDESPPMDSEFEEPEVKITNGRPKRDTKKPRSEHVQQSLSQFKRSGSGRSSSPSQGRGDRSPSSVGGRGRSCSGSRGQGPSSDFVGPSILEFPSESSALEEVSGATFPWKLDLPDFIPSYIDSWLDVKGDGNCGFRAVADMVKGDENKWIEVRKDLHGDLLARQTLYTSVMGGEKFFDESEKGLVHFDGPCNKEKWMTIPEMTWIVATMYNVIVVTISRRQSLTFLPLTSSGDYPDRLIVIGLIKDESHFIAMRLKDDYPIPRIHPSWKKYKDNSVIGWDESLKPKIALWKEKSEQDGHHPADYVILDD